MAPINFLPVEFLILRGISKLMKKARRRTTTLSSKKRVVFRGTDFKIALSGRYSDRYYVNT